MSNPWVNLSWISENVLYAQAASNPLTTNEWTATNATLTVSSTFALIGTNSYRLSSTASGDMSATIIQAHRPVAAEGQVWVAAANFHAGAAARNTQVQIKFYDASNVLLATATSASLIDATGAWQSGLGANVVSAAAPIFTASVELTVIVKSTGGAAELHYFDAALLAMPSLPATWSAGMGDTFAAYEIWRTDDDGTAKIADLTGIGTVSFVDGEPICNATSTYQIRSRRNDGALSAFTAPSSTVTPQLLKGQYAFTSNELQQENWVIATDNTNTRTYKPRHAGQVTKRFFLRDNTITFKPIEDQGDEFTISLQIAMPGSCLVGQATATGRAAFEAIEALGNAQVSYICVRDSDGGRWFAAITVTDLKQTAGVGYSCTVTVEESSSVPSTPYLSP